MGAVEGGPNVVNSGLISVLDIANSKSYVSGSTTWTDLIIPRNGTLTNGPTFNSGNGGSLVFDGTNDYVTFGSALDTGQNFTITSWIKPGAISIRNCIVGNSYPYSGRQGWIFSTATGYASLTNTIFFSIGTDLSYRIAANNSITPNVWNFVCATVANGGTITLYINGIEPSYAGSSLTTGTITYTTNEFHVGLRYTQNNYDFFNGNIANVNIYNRVLSASEILQNYNTTKGKFGL